MAHSYYLAYWEMGNICESEQIKASLLSTCCVLWTGKITWSEAYRCDLLPKFLNLILLKDLRTHTHTLDFYVHFAVRTILYYLSILFLILLVKTLLGALLFQVAMCNFQTIKDAADVAIATMLSGIQVCLFFFWF